MSITDRYELRFPPRGSGNEDEAPPLVKWLAPNELGKAWDHAPGKLLLGHNGSVKEVGDRTIGFWDNRHIVTIAGSRAGKTRTLLIPNLLEYPGSAVVIDPKGELAAATAARRAKPLSEGGLGQRVFVLEPFQLTGGAGRASAHFNVFDELGRSSEENLAADAAQIADALIIESGNDHHWTDSAKNLILGAILFLHVAGEGISLRSLRKLLSDDDALMLSWAMMAEEDALGGRLRNIGRTFLGKVEDGRPGRELLSILSTAREQTGGRSSTPSRCCRTRASPVTCHGQSSPMQCSRRYSTPA